MIKQNRQSFFQCYPTRSQTQWLQADQNQLNLKNQSELKGKFVIRRDKKVQYYDNVKVYDSFLFINDQFIDFDNFHLERSSFGAQPGVILSNNEIKIELYSDDGSLIRSLLKSLALYTIQSDFTHKFTKLKLIGKGSTAKVYKVKRKETSEIFATKQFSKEQMNWDLESNQYALFKEIQILRKLNNPSIIQFYEVYEDQQNIYLILEYLNGGELLQALSENQNQYDELLVKSIIKRLLETLKYIHENNILHRDLKLENIILRNRKCIEDVVISDFGLAEIYDKECDYYFLHCGTLGYVAPEVYQNMYDYKIDCFSLGIIMFILLTGQQPFTAISSKQLLHQNINCDINFQALEEINISNFGIDLCKQLIQKNPELRPSANEALKHAWFNSKPQLSALPVPHLTVHHNLNIPTTLKTTSPLWKDGSPLLGCDSQFQSCKNITSDSSNLIVDYINESQYFSQFQLQQNDQDDYIDDDIIDDHQSPETQIKKYCISMKIRKYGDKM